MEKRESGHSANNSLNIERPNSNDNISEINSNEEHSEEDAIGKSIVSLTIGSSFYLSGSAKLQNIWYLNMQRALLNSFSENLDSQQINYRCDILTNAQGFAIDISSRFGLLYQEKNVSNHKNDDFHSKDDSQVLNAVYKGLSQTTVVNLPVILYNHKNDLMRCFKEIEKEFNCHITVEIRDKEEIQFYSKDNYSVENVESGRRYSQEITDEIENSEEIFSNKLEVVITGLANEVAFSRLKIIRLIESYFNKELQYCEGTQLFYPEMLKDEFAQTNIVEVQDKPDDRRTNLERGLFCVDAIDESAKTILNTIYYSTFVNNPLCLYSHWQPLPFFYRKRIWVNTYKLFFIFLFLKEQLEEILAKMQCCLVVGDIIGGSSELRIFSKVFKSGYCLMSEESIGKKQDMIFQDDDYKRENQILNSLMGQMMSLFESILRLRIPFTSENKITNRKLFQFCLLGLDHVSLTKNQEMVCFLHRENISAVLDKIIEFQTQDSNVMDNSAIQSERFVSHQTYVDEMSLQMVLNNSLADFLCGKKNGKINRIIKETNVRIIVHHDKGRFFYCSRSDNHQNPQNMQQPYTLSREQSDVTLISDSSSSNTSADKHVFMDHSLRTSANDHLDSNASFVTLFTNSAHDLKVALELLLLEFPSSLTFFLPEKYHKRIIGFGGKNIQRIMKKHGVYIKFFSEWEQNQRIFDNHFCRYDAKYLNEKKQRECSTMKEDSSTRKPITFELKQPALGNVVIKTPKKNRKSLILMKKEILSLVGEDYIDHPSRIFKMHPFEYFRFTHSQGNIRIGWNEVVCEDAKLWIEAGGEFISYKYCDLDIMNDNKKICDSIPVPQPKPIPYEEVENKDTLIVQPIQKYSNLNIEKELEQSIEKGNLVIEQILPESQHITTQLDDRSKKGRKLDFISDDLEDTNIGLENRDSSIIYQDETMEDLSEEHLKDSPEINAPEKQVIDDIVTQPPNISNEIPQIIIKEHRHIFSRQLKSRHTLYQLIFNDQNVDMTQEKNIKWLLPVYYEFNDETNKVGHQIKLSDDTKFIRSLSNYGNIQQIINDIDSSIPNSGQNDNLKRYEVTAMAWRSTDLSVFPSKLFSIYQHEGSDKNQSWWCVGTNFEREDHLDPQK